MSSRTSARAVTYRQSASAGEIVARLAVVASVFSWLGVVVALFWR
ncbi:hypothetical protein [Sphingomonas sp. JC676]|nr:hypothetical protein [Sphingomonas sp. JC676]